MPIESIRSNQTTIGLVIGRPLSFPPSLTLFQQRTKVKGRSFATAMV